MDARPIVIALDPDALESRDGGVQQQLEYLRITAEMVVAFLSENDRRCVCLLAGGLSNGDLAAVRWTARRHRERVLRAINVSAAQATFREALGAAGRVTVTAALTDRAFLDRERYFDLRDALTAILANEVTPLLAPDYLVGGEAMAIWRLAAMTAGMLNASALVIGSDSFARLRKRPSRAPYRLRSERAADLDALVRADVAVPVHPRAARWEDLMAAGRMLDSLGVPLHFVEISPGVRLREVLSNATPHAVFVPNDNAVHFTGVRRWLSTGAVPKGTLRVSPIGASTIRARTRGSLLAAGILSVEGHFEANEVVSICAEDGSLIGYGLVRYSSEQLATLRGQADVVVVHADFLFCTPGAFAD